VTLVAGAVFVVALSDAQQQRLQALRSNRWLRVGWIPVWLGVTAAAMCDDGSGRLAAIATGALGICTIWAALIHGWPRVRQLVFMAAIAAIGFGFAGHRIVSGSGEWLLPYAHGVVFAFFLSFAQETGRVWLTQQPRIRLGGVAVWFIGFAALLVLLLQQEERATQFAWAIFTVMAAAGGVLGTTRWNDLRRAVPAFFRGYVHLAWLAFAFVKPNIVACVCVGLMSVWIIEDFKSKRAAR